jgi:hypothetical protein
VASGDTHSYTGAMENYIQTGSYHFYNGKNNVYAGRLPHYSAPYFVFRWFTDQSTAFTLMVIFQVFMEVVGILALAMVAFSLLGSIGFFLMIVLQVISNNATDFSYYISPESLSISTLSIFLFFYIRYHITRKTSALFLAAVFLAWLVTLKVYFLALYLPLGIEFIVHERKRLNAFGSWMVVFKKTVTVSIPLIIILAPWIVRNYVQFEKFIPLQINPQAGYNYNEADFAYRRFVMSWGGDIVHWEKTSAGCYFMPLPEIQCQFVFPDYVFSKYVTIEKIEKVRNNFISLQQEFSIEKETSVRESFDSLTAAFIDDNPFRYHFVTPMVLVKKFLVQSGSYYLPIHTSNPCYNTFQLGIKLVQSALYWLSVIVGIPFLVLICFKRGLLFPAILPFFIIVIFPLVFRVVEWRYFRTVEAVLYIGISSVTIMMFSLIKQKFHPKRKLND